MSVQFGRWNLDGMPVDAGYLEKARRAITPYGPDDEGSYTNHNVAIVYRAFHTTKESRRERQPHFTMSGAVITWDGRLDNRSELIGILGDHVTQDSTDVSIVAAAYDKWETDCFSKLIGDWALSIWQPAQRSLLLAKDPIGTRQLYYSFDQDQVTWSTILDPLVLFADKTFQLNEEYIAGWFSFFPAVHLTPYVGIHSVPPSSFVVLRSGSCSIKRYWDFDPKKRIEYRTDTEYEEHFRWVFREAVRRRLRSDSPILAELSGGMDSSSIVCMSDKLIAEGKAEAPRLDTVSYYDDSEPNWNERPYFTKVEGKRGGVGCHIDISNQERFNFDFHMASFAPIPGSGGKCISGLKQFADCLAGHGNRALLSGIGGDEVMGGVPTPILELEDLLATAKLGALAHQLKVWALNKRAPWFHLLFMTVRRFLPAKPLSLRKQEGPEAWLDRRFVQRNRAAMHGPQTRVKLFGPLPSFQENISTLIGLQRQLTCEYLQVNPLYEKRYPYLDRNLLEFIYAIPREQLVRPAQRRSLMRRALRDLVPTEILERKRKAYVVRSPVVALQAARGQIELILADALTAKYGFIDSRKLPGLVDAILNGRDTKEFSLLIKTVLLELWLRCQAGCLTVTERVGVRHSTSSRIYRAEDVAVM